MTIEEQKELAKKLVREHVFTSTDWETGDLDERLFKAMSVYAEAAKLEERKRIEEALPQMRICDRAEHYDHILEQENFDGFNECLDKVRSIINPQI